MWGFLFSKVFINMNLREDIERIQEVMGIEVSNLFKRKMHIVDRLIYTLIEDSMYPCDYDNEEEFYEGVIYELSWLVKNKDFGLDDVEWLDIYDYITNFKEEELKDYYKERCSNKDV
jgi:hypothetical protein